MNDEEAYKHLAFQDGRTSANHEEAIAALEALGIDVPGLLLEKYKISRRWSDRAICVSHCMEYSKSNEDAYQLGILALQDKSKIVQRKACALLSVSQRHDAIVHLEKLLDDRALRKHAQTAIDALSD